MPRHNAESAALCNTLTIQAAPCSVCYDRIVGRVASTCIDAMDNNKEACAQLGPMCEVLRKLLFRDKRKDR